MTAAMAPAPERQPELRAILRTTGYLAGSAFGSAATGVGFWVFAARLMSPEQLATQGAAVAMLLLVGELGQVNQHVSLPRALPGLGQGAVRSAVLRAYLVATGGSWIFSGAALIYRAVGVGPPLLEGLSTTALVLLMAAAPLWTLFSLQDSMLVGLGRAAWVPTENILYGMAKTIALVVLTWAGVPGALLLAWLVPAALLTVGINVLALRSSAVSPLGGGTAPVDSRDRALAVDYAGSVIGLSTLRLVPIVVLGFLGARSAAPFVLAWQMATVLEGAVGTVGIAFMASAAGLGRAVVGQASRNLLRRAVPLSLILPLLMAAGAPIAAWAFGASLERAALLLAILGLALPGRLILAVVTARMRLNGDSGSLFAVQAARLPAAAILCFGGAVLWDAAGVAAGHVVATTALALSCVVWLKRKP